MKPHPDFGEWVNTKEVQKRGAWHFHLVIVLSQDIRQGVDFEKLAKGNYTSASPFLRRIWKELREALPLYGFGRSELLPVKSNADGIARYVGKYISKHIGTRADDHKGIRLISYSNGWERNSIRFAWNTTNAKEWRRKLSLFADRHGCQEFYQLSAKLGPGWAYRYSQEIIDIDQAIIQDKINAQKQGREITRREYKDATITRARSKNSAREKKMMRELVNHARVGVNLEEKRKIEQAKHKIKQWKNNLKEEPPPINESRDGTVKVRGGKYIEINGYPTLVGGKLVYHGGKRDGEEIF